MSFKVWCPDSGQSEETAVEIDPSMSRWNEAAEYYAEHHAGWYGDPFSSIEVMVKNMETGEVIHAEVEVEPVPSFCAFKLSKITNA